MRSVFTLDENWKFHLGDIVDKDKNSHAQTYSHCKAGGIEGPAGRSYDDADWQRVDLPHDYLAYSGFSADNLLSHGYRYRDNAWYRKTFVLGEELKGKHAYLCFEGTAVNAEFYFNGSLAAHSYSAYVETGIDITDRIQYGPAGINTLAVHINGLATEGWWYEGAGIYRHVRLYIKEPLHIAHNGVFIKPVKISEEAWTVYIETQAENSAYEKGRAKAVVELYDGDKKICESTSAETEVPAASSVVIKQSFTVTSPKLWDVDAPNLYSVKITLVADGEEKDSVVERTGFRTFAVTAEKGFFLNGRPLKIKGTCNHQDHAGVGVAVPDSLQYYRIKLLKQLGTNAYRCAHNPPAKEILDACDEMGLIVMDENRRFETGEEYIANLRTLIKRDRNHPSVIFWSLFNEEPLQNTELGARIFRRLKAVTRSLDDSRIITGAINGNMQGAGMEMDVTGINYAIDKISEMHAQNPAQPIIGSENNSAVTTRGCYKTDSDKHVLAGYDEETVPWGQTVRETWDFVRKNDYFAGIFIWTGFDYRGEPTPYKWPSVSSQFGIMDTCGFAKDSYYFNKACFTDKPMVHIMPHWNHRKGETVRVAAVTNCDSVELILNGRSLGKKASDCINTPEWMVPYEPGTIEAAGFVGGSEVCRDQCTTAGAAAVIAAECSSLTIGDDGQDTAVVNLSLKDKKGVMLPQAANLLHFETTGDIFVRGVGNGDPNSHESDVKPRRKLYAGRCQALISAKRGGKNGTLIIKAAGLPTKTIEFTLVPFKNNELPSAESYLITDFTVSAITAEKPDPLMEIADNDMNSFMPVSTVGTHQNDFHSGWRIYRAILDLPSGKKYGMVFNWLESDYTEVYVNGGLVYKDKKAGAASPKMLECEIPVASGASVELRILMYSKDRLYAGIRDGIKIIVGA